MPRKKAQPETPIINPEIKPVVSKASSLSLQTVLIAITILLMLGIIALLYVQSQKATEELNQLKQQQAEKVESVDETQALIDELAQILVLPENEQPTIATVTDLSKLGSQPFFEGAGVGDKVIIYSTSKKAILYRPSEKKVINIAPLTSDISTESNSEEASNKTKN